VTALETPAAVAAPARTLTDLGGYALIGVALTAHWSVVTIGSLQLVDIFLVLAAACIGAEALGARAQLRAPKWVWAGAAGVAAVIVSHILIPTDAPFMNGRIYLSGLSGGFAYGVTGPTIAGLKWLAALLLLPLLTSAVAGRGPRVVNRVAVAWLAGAVGSAVVATTDLLGATSINVTLTGLAENSSGRMSGLQSHPNNLAVGCALVAPIAVLIATRWRHAWIGGPALMLLGLGALASGSRGGQVGFVVAVAATSVLLAGRRCGKPLAILAGGGIFTVLTIRALESIVGPVLRFKTAADSDIGRRMIREQAILDLQHRPLDGVGLDQITYAHSIYLQMLSAGGLILAAAMVAFFCGAIAAAWSLRSHQLAVCLGVSITTWAVIGVIENQLTDRYLYVPIALLAAMTIANQASHAAPIGAHQ
jgi:hypothetical protein